VTRPFLRNRRCVLLARFSFDSRPCISKRLSIADLSRALQAGRRERERGKQDERKESTSDWSTEVVCIIDQQVFVHAWTTTPTSHGAGTTLPGFMILYGSRPFLTICIIIVAPGPYCRSKYLILPYPTPCSPVQVPPANNVRSIKFSFT
jgi:hypothetical protein